MTVKNFNVGPSQLFGNTATFLHDIFENGIATVPHRSEAFSEIYKHTESTFKSFFEIPDDYKVFFTYSATDGMDIIIDALADEEVTHVDNGTFGKLFIAATQYAGKETNVIVSRNQKRVDVSDIYTKNSTLIVTANDTASGMEYNKEELIKIKEQNPDSLLVVDATSSFGALDYNISMADVWVLSVQKNLGLPS
jgi:phosphoserine aminotransferase